MKAGKFPQIAVLAVLLLGLALRLAPFGENRFLEDEALYSYWGLQIATGADLRLDREPVDKPPLHPYALALSFLLFGSIQPVATSASGQGDPAVGEALAARQANSRAPVPQLEWAARLVSLFASVASIAVVFALGRQLFADALAGLVAALLLALSPFDILFASTAFTDPLMIALALGALLAAVRGRPSASGLLTGLAAATKQQGLLFLPLILAIIVISPDRWRRSDWLRFGLGFLVVVGSVIAWDRVRLQRPGFLGQGLVSYGGLHLANAAALPQRGKSWLELLSQFWAAPRFLGLLLAAFALSGILAARKHITRERSRHHAAMEPGLRPVGPASASPGHAISILAVYLAAFLALHWLVDFQVWDRYLLGLVALLALLAAGLFQRLGGAIQPKSCRRAYAIALAVILAATLIPGSVRAANSGVPVGGDHGSYDGIDDLAAQIRRHTPPGSVLYDHWLGYHYRFYLYGAPLHVHWYPDLTDLVEDASMYRREARYIAFPSWRASGAEERALAGAGIRLVPLYQTLRRDGSVSFRLYRMEGP